MREDTEKEEFFWGSSLWLLERMTFLGREHVEEPRWKWALRAPGGQTAPAEAVRGQVSSSFSRWRGGSAESQKAGWGSERAASWSLGCEIRDDSWTTKWKASLRREPEARDKLMRGQSWRQRRAGAAWASGRQSRNGKNKGTAADDQRPVLVINCCCLVAKSYLTLWQLHGL